MSQKLDGFFAILCIEKKLLHKINIDAIINNGFASANVRRKF
jgi:hypothetical protein